MEVKWDLKVAGTETLPFLSNLFSKLDKNIIFKTLLSNKPFQITLRFGIIWDSMGFNKIVNILVIEHISTNIEHFRLENKIAR